MPFTPPTLLSLVGIDLGDYSARGLTLELQPIQSNSGLRRTVNGGLLDLTAPQFRKYSASISCEDVDAPVLTDIWQGMPVSITLIPETGIGVVTLSMLVDSWTTSAQEWEHLTSWTINLLEA
jgi:hypothetical protein